jgi:hypothetical protein
MLELRPSRYVAKTLSQKLYLPVLKRFRLKGRRIESRFLPSSRNGACRGAASRWGDSPPRPTAPAPPMAHGCGLCLRTLPAGSAGKAHETSFCG